MTAPASRCADKPWPALLDDAERAPIERADSLVHAFRRSGFKVWPREVEDVLYTRPAVREAAVVGALDGYRGETVKAYSGLRPDAGANADTLAAYCKDRLAAYECPRQVEILPDLPRTASGKILRRELRSRARDGSVARSQ